MESGVKQSYTGHLTDKLLLYVKTSMLHVKSAWDSMAYLSVGLFVRLSVGLSVRLLVSLSVRLSVSLSVRLLVTLSVRLSVSLSVRL